MLPRPYDSLDAVEKVCINFENVRREDLDRVFQLLRNEKDAEVFDKCSLYLMPVITECLTKDKYRINRGVCDVSKSLLKLLAQNSTAEITSYQLTSLLKSADRNETFLIILEALVIPLCKHPEWFEGCGSSCFSTINSYVEQLDVSSQDPKEIMDLYQGIVKFYTTAIDETKHPAMLSHMRPFLIQLLGDPVCFKQDASSESLQFRTIMHAMVANILKLIADPLEFIQHPPAMKFHPDELAVAHLFYLVYHEGVGLKAVPKVYGPDFVFQLSMDLLCTLLESGHDGLVDKALKLASRLLVPITEEKWSHMLLEHESTEQFLSILATTVVYNNITEIRQMALKCLTTFVLRFDTTGVYLILKHLLAVQSHSGLKGYLITLYKDLLDREWGDNMSEYLKGIHLNSFLMDCCRLNEKEDSELSEQFEQIISALNLIRYLLLKDRNNVTQVSSCLARLEESYLKPLKKSIKLSRDRLEQDVRTTIDERTIPQGEIGVVVAGEKVERSSKEERIASLKSSLIGLDVINSVLCRVMELLEEN